MALRQREWAAKTRDKLFTILGPWCKYCGATENLQLDVIIPVGNDKHHREYDWSWRMSFYRAQHAKKNLQALCDKCNARKKNREEMECPF
jgi:5-methylcytosine-specific restriction endonuclease McrA